MSGKVIQGTVGRSKQSALRLVRGRRIALRLLRPTGGGAMRSRLLRPTQSSIDIPNF